jgi:hypothetical protein
MAERFEMDIYAFVLMGNHYHLLLRTRRQSGLCSNAEIVGQVGLTVSSVSRRVGVFQELLSTDRKLRENYERFKSIIKV